MAPLIVVLALTTTIAPEVQMGKNFAFVVDVSTSMDAHLATAVENFLEVASQPVDDMTMKVRAFGSSTVVMHLPKAGDDGWISLPNANAVVGAGAWLRSRKTRRAAGGCTKVIPALRAALREPKDHLTVVLMTDGEFYVMGESDKMILEEIEKQQKWRVQKKLGRAVIAVVGYGTDKILTDIAKCGRGGLYTQPEKKPEPADCAK